MLIIFRLTKIIREPFPKKASNFRFPKIVKIISVRNIMFDNSKRWIKFLNNKDYSLRELGLTIISNKLTYFSTSSNQSCAFLKAIIQGTMHNPLFLNLNNPIDKCRELALEIIRKTAKISSVVHKLLLTLVSTITSRRTNMSQNMETKEKIRIKIFDILDGPILYKTEQNTLAIASKELKTIISWGLEDSYHEIIISACNILCHLVIKLRPFNLPSVSDSIMKKLFVNLSHCHSKVRQRTVESLQILLEAVDLSRNHLKSTFISSLILMVNDQIPYVRKTVFQTICGWIISKGYSSIFLYHLLPIMLLSLTDNDENIAIYTILNLKRISSVWLFRENIQYDNLNLDYSLKKSQTSVLRLLIYKIHGKGLTLMTQKVLPKILSAILENLLKWKVEIRFTALRILLSLILISDDIFSKRIKYILPILSMNIDDKAKIIVNSIRKMINMIALFIPVDYWFYLALDLACSFESKSQQGQNGKLVYGLLTISAHKSHKRIDKRYVHSAAYRLSIKYFQEMNPFLAKLYLLSTLNESSRKNEDIIRIILLTQYYKTNNLFCDNILKHMYYFKIKNLSREIKFQTFSGELMNIVLDLIFQNTKNGIYEERFSVLFSPLILRINEFNFITSSSCIYGISSYASNSILTNKLNIFMENITDRIAINGKINAQLINILFLPFCIKRSRKIDAVLRLQICFVLFTLIRNQEISPNVLFQSFFTSVEPMTILNYFVTHNNYLNTRLYACGLLKIVFIECGHLIRKKQKLKVHREIEKRLYDNKNNTLNEILSILRRLIHHDLLILTRTKKTY